MPIPPAEFQPYPYPKRRISTTGEPMTRPEEQLKKDLRALERVQASRPMKPPGKR